MAATLTIDPPSVIPPDPEDTYGGDDDQCLLNCSRCEFIYFAPRSQFETIRRRQNMCPDCYYNYTMESWGLDPKIFPRRQTQVDSKL